jgi:hypothetical protein
MTSPSFGSTFFAVVSLLLALVATPRYVQADDTPCQTPSLGGYAEVFGTLASETASDGALPFRGFDNRANTVSISNIALSAQLRCGDVARGWGRAQLDLTLQWGLTPNTYYLGEPSYMSHDGVGESSASSWRFLQQALVSWRRETSAGRYWQLEAGIFPSPLGPEGMAVKDGWNWSRSNLFFGLAFYHVGARLTHGMGGWRVTASLLNGWNSIVDNNDEKTGHLQVVYETDAVVWSAQIMSGVERSPGDPAGRGVWRSLFDTYLTAHPSAWLSLQAHFDAGVEPGALGTDWWVAGAAYLRLRPWPVSLPGLTFAARGDLFYEAVPPGGAPIFWPMAIGARDTLMSSATATMRFEVPHGAIYLESRADYSTNQGIWNPGASHPQNWRETATLGLTAWF